MSVLLGDLVSLREVQKGDMPLIQQWSHDPEIIFLADGESSADALQEGEFVNLRSSRSRKHFVIIVKNEVIGDIELDQIAWRSGDAELLIRIGRKELWNNGYGTDAVKLLLEHAFLTMRLKRIYLRVFAHNPRAIRCYHKAGFKKEGKIASERGDVLLMRILRNEYLRRHNLLDNAV